MAEPSGPRAGFGERAIAAIALFLLRPARVRVPALAAPTVLAALWLFELHRYSIL